MLIYIYICIYIYVSSDSETILHSLHDIEWHGELDMWLRLAQRLTCALDLFNVRHVIGALPHLCIPSDLCDW